MQQASLIQVLLLIVVPSQVVLSRTLAKKEMLMSVATKIAIQLNVKMGGEVWALEVPVGIVIVN
jgi:aubergine